jgi:hypothetical protein
MEDRSSWASDPYTGDRADGRPFVQHRRPSERGQDKADDEGAPPFSAI